jgi:hypothetical protein
MALIDEETWKMTMWEKRGKSYKLECQRVRMKIMMERRLGGRIVMKSCLGARIVMVKRQHSAACAQY